MQTWQIGDVAACTHYVLYYSVRDSVGERPDKYICESGDIICERICTRVRERERARGAETDDGRNLFAEPEQNYPIVRARWMML
jgi:hypothetical protein